MDSEWQIAYQRERQARLAAERMLDEKTREVQAAMDVMHFQNQSLHASNTELQLLMNLANAMQTPMSFREALALYSHSLALMLPCVFAWSLWPSRKQDGHWVAIDEAIVRVPLPSTTMTWLQQFNQPLLPHQQRAFESGEIQSFKPPVDDSLYAPLCEASVRWFITVPLKRHGVVTALSEFAFVDKCLCPPAYLQMMQAAAQQVGVVIERREQEKRLHENFQQLQRAHHELQDTQRQLLQSEKMASLGQLAAGVAHEINNPVGFVISNIGSLKEYIVALTELAHLVDGLLKQIDENHPAAAHAQRIRQHWKQNDLNFVLNDLDSLLHDSEGGLLRVRDIVANLREFARADDNKREATDLAALIDNTIKIVWNELKYKVELHKEISEIPAVDCNSGQIAQVLVNLLVNAAQAIDTRGTITIRLTSENQMAVLSVEDTGKGMSESVLKRVFEPFFTTKPVGIGTGLGLSIAYGIMQAHKGSISVTSVEGKGTSFRLSLPLHGAINKTN